MSSKINSIKKNRTQILVELSIDKKTIGCRRLFRVKYRFDGSIDKYEACLVAKRLCA